MGTRTSTSLRRMLRMAALLVIGGAACAENAPLRAPPHDAGTDLVSTDSARDVAGAEAAPADAGGDTGPAEAVQDAAPEGAVADAPLADVGEPQKDYDLQIRPPSTDFGVVQIGQPGARRTLAVMNRGARGAAALTFEVAGSAAFAIPPGGNRCGGKLASGQACEVDVVFTPTRAGADGAQLAARFAGSAIVELRGFGKASPGHLVVSPTVLDFGPVPVRLTSNALVVRLVNDGGENVNLLTAIEGKSASDFAAGACASVLPPAGVCVIVVTFTPSAVGTATADLVVTSSSGGPVRVAMSGVGVVGDFLSVEPTSLDFGEAPVGTGSGTGIFTLRNASDLSDGAGRRRQDGHGCR